MSWLHHHKFVPVRDQVLRLFVSKQASFSKLRPVVFLCGGHRSAVRDRIADYCRERHSKLLLFYADEVWNEISTRGRLNALQMENELAALADMLLIVVESAGTFAELGAFSLSEALRKKLLPVLDRKFQTDASFVNTGPVRWVDNESVYAPVIWTSHKRVLECASELDDRIGRLSKRSSARVESVADSPKHLLFRVCDLVSVFGPTSIEDIEFYLSKTLDGPAAMSTVSLVGLAVAAGLIRSLKNAGSESVYYRPLDQGRLVSFQRRRTLFVPRLRLQVISVLQLIPEARRALSHLGTAA